MGARLTAVVHLVWGPLGTAPLTRFLDSYRRHPAGLEHELVMLLNNVDKRQRDEVVSALDGFDHHLLALERPVQDLAAYLFAAEQLEHERLCFLNSYSELLAPEWLAKLANALEFPGAGIVGASGSWASLRSATLNALFLPNAYRGVIPPRRVARVQVREMAVELDRERVADEHAGDGPPSETPTTLRRRLAEGLGPALRTLPTMPGQVVRFEGFPNAHMRTNAFMASRRTLIDIRRDGIESKMDAYLLESGRNSLTRQIQRQGLRALVVDSEGTSFEENHWARSRTLWQGDQELLLVADNQTRIYARGSLERRRLLSGFAWGRQAEAGPPLVKSGG